MDIKMICHSFYLCSLHYIWYVCHCFNSQLCGVHYALVSVCLFTCRWTSIWSLIKHLNLIHHLHIPFFVFQSVLPSSLYLGEEPHSYLLLFLCASSVKKHRSFLEVWGELNRDLTTIVMFICLRVNGASVCICVFLLSFYLFVYLFISLSFFGNLPPSNSVLGWSDVEEHLTSIILCAKALIFKQWTRKSNKSTFFKSFFDQQCLKLTRNMNAL